MPTDEARVEQLLKRLASARFVRLDEEELAALLRAGEILREEDTGMSGKIRLLIWRGRHLVQEFTDCGEARLRQFADRREADTFIQQRLDTYERMWDGCGCQVNYDE